MSYASSRALEAYRFQLDVWYAILIEQAVAKHRDAALFRQLGEHRRNRSRLLLLPRCVGKESDHFGRTATTFDAELVLPAPSKATT
jgi:hypothetical protein